ncbi:MAG: tRNA pseudouridine(38-40) synthase TruA [Planctomycetota bacterium]
MAAGASGGEQLGLELAYDGTAYNGWQSQPPPHDTVQGEVEKAIARITGCTIRLIGAGRTDAGVHALGQVAVARLATHLPLAELRKALNAVLPGDIRVKSVRRVPAAFHPQHDAIDKTYFYQIHVGSFLPPFRRHCFYHSRVALDLERMRAAARVLVGEHDFRSFTTQAHLKKSTVRCVRRLWILRIPSGLRVFVTADGFLYNMVRAFVGALLKVGAGDLSAPDLHTILTARDRRAAPPNAPPQGLFLWRVRYAVRDQPLASRRRPSSTSAGGNC